MQLKGVLCQIDADDGNLSHGSLPLLCVALTPQTSHIAMPSGRLESTHLLATDRQQNMKLNSPQQAV